MNGKIVSFIAGCVCILLSCNKAEGPDSGQTDGFTITFETKGGLPVPDPQVVKKGGFVEEPAVVPEKEGTTFSGWYTSTGLKYNFKSTPVSKDMTLYAKYWAGPKKYVFINDYDWSYLESAVRGRFSASGKSPSISSGSGRSKRQQTVSSATARQKGGSMICVNSPVGIEK